MSNLKYRLLVIAALVAASLWALFPRTVIERVNRNGVFVTDTARRVPLRRGLDLQGGMHLTMEIDESKGTVQNKADALERALKVVRTRIDELGVAEPTVQQVGEDRIFVELPGIDDPSARGRSSRRPPTSSSRSPTRRRRSSARCRGSTRWPRRSCGGGRP
jgi:preprotein translocase subunit SecD